MMIASQQTHENPELVASAHTARPLVSVVMPVYNERATLADVVARVLAAAPSLQPLMSAPTDATDRGAIRSPLELIVVDDASRDDSAETLESVLEKGSVQLLRHETNRGKGAALRTGFAAAAGEAILVQDADLEYDPADYPQLVAPILAGQADMVLGSRFLTGRAGGMPLLPRLANRLLTATFNRVYRQRLTDVETGYKVFRRGTLHDILPALREDRFGIEIELLARCAKLPDCRIVELPISYEPRSRRAGKKITWRDGLAALRCIARYR